LPVTSDGDVLADVLEFVNGRLEVVLREQGHAASVVKAVLAEQGHDPYVAGETAVALSEAITVGDWSQLLDAYARCVRITRTQETQFDLRPDAFALPAEQRLLAAYRDAASQMDGSVPTFVASLREMVPVINAFFDAVLVMDEDTAVRENRLALLQHIANLTQGIADLSYLEGF
jgi:glycyl-tRNA synthetase beta subunit